MPPVLERLKARLFGQELELQGAAVKHIGVPIVAGLVIVACVAAFFYAAYGRPAEILAAQAEQGEKLVAVSGKVDKVVEDVAKLQAGQDAMMRALLADSRSRRDAVAFATTPTQEP